MHSFVTSKNAQWPRLIWPTLYVRNVAHEQYKSAKTNYNFPLEMTLPSLPSYHNANVGDIPLPPIPLLSLLSSSP